MTTICPGDNMRKYLTDKEIKERLKDMTIICDTREQVNYHITEYLSSKRLPFKTRKLDAGDYSFEIGEAAFDDEIAIERKANIDELAGNLTAGRQRFEDEFYRAKANGTKIFLLIENCSWQKIRSHDYRSKLNPNSLKATLLEWQARYNITIIFCNPQESGEIIYGICYYWLRNHLKYIAGDIK